MRVREHFTDVGYKCIVCGYTATRWYALSNEIDFEIDTDGKPTWCCIDCMMEYIITSCEVSTI